MLTVAKVCDTAVAPEAACCTLLVMLRVAAFCSSTAAAIEPEISLISPIVPPMPRIASTAWRVAAWISIDLRCDVLGRLGRLAGERLHLGSDDGKAFPRLAGAGRLDRGVERQEIGLAGDVVDELHHFADALRRLRQALHRSVGALRLVDRLARDRRGLGDLAADRLGRGGELLHRSGDGVHVLGRLAQRVHRALRLRAVAAGALGEALGGLLHRLRCFRDPLDAGLERRLELPRHSQHGAAALDLYLFVDAELFGVELLLALAGGRHRVHRCLVTGKEPDQVLRQPDQYPSLDDNDAAMQQHAPETRAIGEDR